MTQTKSDPAPLPSPSLRRLFVPLSGTESDQAVLKDAGHLARRLSAHLDAILVRPDPMAEALSLMGTGHVADNIRDDIMRSHSAAWDDIEASSRVAFHTVAKAEGLTVVEGPVGPGQGTARFIAIEGRRDIEVPRGARTADLTLFALPYGEVPSFLPDITERTLFRSGRPVLFLPPGDQRLKAKRILLAWDASGPAARAVGDALPLLQLADDVAVVSVEETSPSKPYPEDLADYLAWHGIKARPVEIPSDFLQIGPRLLEYARETHVDFMVMGAYVHSPIQEWFVSGPTRYILQHTPIPVLQAH